MTGFVSGGWKDPDYRKPTAQPVRRVTPEQAAATTEFYRGIREQLQRDSAESIAAWEARYRPAAENAATRKIKDMEARVAVEGNTDGNHDNVEAGHGAA